MRGTIVGRRDFHRSDVTNVFQFLGKHQELLVSIIGTTSRRHDSPTGACASMSNTTCSASNVEEHRIFFTQYHVHCTERNVFNLIDLIAELLSVITRKPLNNDFCGLH